MRRFATLLAIAIGLSPASLTAQSLDLSITDPDQIAAECGGTADAGEHLFAASCAACHAVQADGALSLPGPHLEGLFGRAMASLPEFDYSPSLREAATRGDVWERETLHVFLETAATSPGHPKVADEQTRRDILTYLRTVTLPPPPKPGEMEIPAAVLSMAGDVPFGEYLSGECAACHVAGAEGVPSIAGLDRVSLITALFEYRARARKNQTMQIVAARLSDEEIVALASYFETLQ